MWSWIEDTGQCLDSNIFDKEIELDIEGDTFFPTFDHLNFAETSRQSDCENDISFDYVTYTKQK